MRKKVALTFLLMLVMSCMFGLGTVMMTFASETDPQASVPETIFDDYDDLNKLDPLTDKTYFASNGDGAGRYQGDVNQKVLIGYWTDKAVYATNGQNHATVVQYVESNTIAGDLNFYQGDVDGNFIEVEYFSKTYTSPNLTTGQNARNVYEIYFDEESKYFAFTFDNWRGWEVTVGSTTINYVADVPSEKPYADRTFSGLALGANMDESNNLKMDNAQYRGTAEDPWYIDSFTSDAHYGYYALTSASAEGETWFTLKTNQHTRLAFMSAERNGDNGELNFSPFTFSYVNEQGETVAITEDNINRQIQVYDHVPDTNFSQWSYVAYSVYFPETAKAVTVKFGNNRPGQQLIIAGASEAQNTEYEYMLLDNAAKPVNAITFEINAVVDGNKIYIETDSQPSAEFSDTTEGIAFLYKDGVLTERKYGARSGGEDRKYSWEFDSEEATSGSTYSVSCVIFEKYTYSTGGYEEELTVDYQSGAKEITAIPAGHMLTHHEAVAATCTENGNIEYWSCSGCGKNFSNAEGTAEVADISISAKGHTFGEWQTVTAATCSEAGTEKRVCECGEEETRAIPAIGHTISAVSEKAPTEEEIGNIEYWICSVCGKYFSDADGNTEIADKKTVNTYLIVYELNGGTNAENNPAVYRYGTEVVLGAASKTGYTFDGWYTDEAFETKVESLSVSQEGNVTLYAKWTASDTQPGSDNEETDDEDKDAGCGSNIAAMSGLSGMICAGIAVLLLLNRKKER